LQLTTQHKLRRRCMSSLRQPNHTSWLVPEVLVALEVLGEQEVLVEPVGWEVCPLGCMLAVQLVEYHIPLGLSKDRLV